MKKLKLIDWFFFFTLFLIFFLPPIDPDLGWQLRCGQEIWSGKSFCSRNQFSVLAENYAWPNHHWLYQATIFAIFKLAGLWGLTLINGSLMSSALGFFYLAIKNYRWEKMLAIGLTAFLAWGVFSLGIRAQLIGFLFFNCLLWLLTRTQKRPDLSIFFPLIMVLWANMHGSVIVGLMLLAFFWLREAIISFSSRKKQTKRILIVSFILLASSIVTLVNPFGLGIYQEAWRHFGGVDLSKLILEWVPPIKVVWWTVLVSSLVLFVYLFVGSKFQDLILAFLIFGFAFLALKARRHVPFYFSLAFYLFFASAFTRKVFGSWLKKKILRSNLALLTTIVFLFYGLLIRLPQALETNSSWEKYCQRSLVGYPNQAVEFLRNQPTKGAIFNRYEWGGFLIWQLPEYKIFVDGRMPAWPTPSGKSPYTIYLETLQARPGWQETLEEYNISWILISPSTFMDLELKPDPEKFGWGEVYRDKTAVVYQKI